MNYDPNLTNSGRTAKQTVKLTFGMWEYRAERTVEVGGNCTGLTVIESAIGNLYEDLPNLSDGMGSMVPGIVMADPNDADKELCCTDDEDQGDDWLKDMLIGAEIIDIRPDRDLFAEARAKEKNNQILP